MMNTNLSTSQEAELDKVIERIRSYANPPLTPSEPLHLEADGLSENPGVMGAGIYIRQGDTCFAAESMFLGHGTCNEAEYLALLNGLRIVRALYPNPEVPVIAQSDSQLVVHQVHGSWKARNQMRWYCGALMQFQMEYPFELIQVPREQNMMADALAQQIVLKHSGRSLSLENGRFDRSKQAPATMRRRSTYLDLTTHEFRSYIEQFNLRGNFRRLRELIAEERQAEAAALVQRTLAQAELVLTNAPKSNAVVARWAADSVGIIRTSLTEILKLIEQRDAEGIKYYIDEMAGEPSDTEGDGLFSQQVDTLREGLGLEQFVDVSDVGCVCEEGA
jgi:ribonuclease HI